MANQLLRTAACLLATLATFARTAEPANQEPLSMPPCPARVNELRPGFEAAAKGIAVGDCIEAWKATAASAAMPLDDQITLLRIELEDAPSGEVELALRRGDQRRWVAMATLNWGIETRPDLPADHEARWRDWAAGLAPGALAPPPPPHGGRRQHAVLALSAAAILRKFDPIMADTVLAEAQAGLDAATDPVAVAMLTIRRCGHLQQSLQLVAASDVCSAAEDAVKAARLTRTASRVRLLRAGVARLRDQRMQARELLVALEGEVRATHGAESLLMVSWLHERASLLRLEERLDEAVADLRHGMALLVRLGAADRLRLSYLSTLGLVQRARGELAEARTLLGQAVQLSAQIEPDSIQLSRDLNNLALLQWDQMDMAEALASLEQSLAIKRRRNAASLDLAATLSNLALLALPLGRIDAAAAFVDEAITLRAPLGANLAHANELTLLARVSAARGDGSAALRQYDAALAMFAVVAPDSIAESWARYFLAGQLAEEQRLDEALVEARRAVTIQRKIGPSGRELGFGRQREGELLARLGREADAESALQDAVAIRRRHAPDSQTLAHALAALAALQEQRGDALRAGQLQCEAVEVLERQRWRWTQARDDLLEYGRSSAPIYRACARAKLHQGDPVGAFDIIEQGRARLLLDGTARLRSASLDALPDPLAQGWRDLHAAQTRLSPTELRARRQQLAASIKAVAPNFAADLLAIPIGWVELAPRLPADTGLLSHWFDGRSLWIVFARPGDATPTFLAVPDTSAEVLQQARAFSAALRQADADPLVLARLGAWLHTRLIAPILGRSAGLSRLLLLPDPVMALLPYGALQDPEGRFLIERFALRFSPSLSSAAATSPRRPASAKPLTLVVADAASLAPQALPANLRSAASPISFPRLPGARREADDIARLFRPQVEVLSGDAATERAVRERIGNAQRIHFAVHGLLNTSDPLDSALLLARGSGHVNDDGLLQVRELLLEVPLQAEFVAVSACNLGGGQLDAGEGLLGLRHALRLAGVAGVLSSLWEVADSDAEQLARIFYRELRRGRPADLALQSAQRSLIGRAPDATDARRGVGGLTARAGPSANRHPHRWAAFTLDGGLD